MGPTHMTIKYSLNDTETVKLSQAARLIREVLRSVDEYCPLEDDRLDAIPVNEDASSLLRLVALTLEDEVAINVPSPRTSPTDA